MFVAGIVIDKIQIGFPQNKFYWCTGFLRNCVSTKPTLYVWKRQDTTFYTPQYQMVSQQNQPCMYEKGKILLSTHRNTKWCLNKTNPVCMKEARYYFLHTAIPNGVSTKPTLYVWKRQDTTFYTLQYQMVSQQNQPCMYEKGKILLSTHGNTKLCLNKTNPVCMKKIKILLSTHRNTKWSLNKTNSVWMNKARYYFLHTAILNGVSTKPTLYVWKRQDTTFYTLQYQMVSQQNQPCMNENGKFASSVALAMYCFMRVHHSLWLLFLISLGCDQSFFWHSLEQ